MSCIIKELDSVNAQYILGMQTVGSCSAQPLKTVYTSLVNFLFRRKLSEIYLSIKDLEILAEFRLLQIRHLCKQKSVCATNF